MQTVTTQCARCASQNGFPDPGCKELRLARRQSRQSIVSLCASYNSATCPWAPRTEHEHSKQNVRARAALARIRSRFIEGRDYFELSSGALWPR